ncbi:MAG TPA: chromosome segregation protein [Opitutae bacterium]|nr:chromosome segregation protein [Opitutaceae bacterium]HCR29792.1 chromosome segregation protein [Opitutae bacterium]
MVKPISLAVFLLPASLSLAEQEPINFNRDIFPILSDKCFHCHGPDDTDREEDLRLDIPDGPLGTLTPRDDYHIIKPGEPEESELWFRVTSEFDDEIMPPKSSHKAPLTEEEVELITQWIEDGGTYEAFWAFVPPKREEPGKVRNREWNRSPIDRIVYSELLKRDLSPKEEADKRTLVRRLSLDLTGLPPLVEEIDAFLADKRPSAYETLVDKLMSRPAYGEHMARYWADLVRLADTNGMHKDFHREFSPYRDWLIDSFNENLPFDDFIAYQLAGDLFEEPSRDQLIASGYNRMHMIIDRGTALPEESLHKNVIDRVEAFGTTFLGLTVQCAQCHDHKYDPLTQKDYYQLYAFFNNFAGAPETVRAPERGLQPPYINLSSPKQEQLLATFDAQKLDAEIRRDATLRLQSASEKWPENWDLVEVPFIETSRAIASKTVEFETSLSLEGEPGTAVARFIAGEPVELWVNGNLIGQTFDRKQGAAAELSAILQTGSNTIRAVAKRPTEFGLVLDYTIGDQELRLTTGPDWNTRTGTENSWTTAEAASETHWDSKWTKSAESVEVLAILHEIKRIQKERSAYLRTVPGAMHMAERSPPRQATMLVGGAYDAPGEAVERNTPAFLPPMEPKEEMYTRLDLAEWLVSPEHPLTARVAVNRIWQQFFGVGLVKTAEDFGAQGEWPSHPELLDTLAVSFMESGWDVKELVKVIVMSKTYRQSSDANPEEYKQDPENRLLARGSRFRLDAEVIRDQILAVSGLLNRELYGKSVKPPQPPGLWEMVSMTSENKTYIADTGDDIYRRSLYTYWRRGMPPPQMTLMNAPSREFCVARRERTNTSLQALLLMNESEYFNAAKVMAQDLLNRSGSERETLSLAYEMTTSMEPDRNRLKLMENTLVDFRDYYEANPDLVKSLGADFDQAPEVDRPELAAWTMMTHSLLNLELVKNRR